MFKSNEREKEKTQNQTGENVPSQHYQQQWAKINTSGREIKGEKQERKA